MKKTLAIFGILTIVVFCGSWGPITHNSMAQKIAGEASGGDWNYRSDAFYSGTIAPDIALAAKPGTFDNRQYMFHDGAYVDALYKVAGDSYQKILFVRGYEVHLICDGIEGEYGATKKGAPVSLEFAVDKLVGSSGGGNISQTYLDMMLAAWQIAYPSDTSVTAAWLKKAEGNFGLYMSGIYNPVSKADAEKYFGDYRAWYDQSVTESVAYLKALNVVPEPTIPPPTFTLAPPTTTIAPPTTTPEPTIEPRQDKMKMPYYDSGIRLKLEPLGDVFVSFARTLFQWLTSLLTLKNYIVIIPV